ncbi:MAG TPA: tRNA (adenosine(37)-N6)-dimethylallyltransferase MiaA [Bacteroidia bacterium]|nr:tRNA (adenosine(37)-N6)-dimethylallyltransferase MiaA [Bacteroidia bacterium]
MAGPTAVGKTGLAIELAGHYKTLIISADSRQIYKELNIGTAKPSPEQLQQVPHLFVGTKNVTELYGAGHFEKDVMETLNENFKHHNIIFLVGGSGLYIDAVLNGVDDFVEVPENIRQQLNLEFKEKGVSWLQGEIKKHDPVYFDLVDAQNPQRMIRALEVFRYTGLPFSSFLSKKKISRDFVPIKIMINTGREKLYNQINNRVDEMIRLGLTDEVKSLLPYKNFNALKTVGYKEIYDYLEGKTTFETAVDKIKQHTRNYAKRQITWFKNKDQFKEFEPGDADQIIRYIDEIISG